MQYLIYSLVLQLSSCEGENWLHCLFDWFDYLRPIHQYFSNVGTCLDWLNQYLARINVSCSRTPYSDTGEVRTRNLSASSQALYY